MIQNRYETIRLVRYERASIHKAISDFGFKSRSSYYLFSSQIREQGFIGLFDLRQFELETAIHNFVRPHRSLKYNTPMMAAGKTGHVWSVEELLSFSV